MRTILTTAFCLLLLVGAAVIYLRADPPNEIFQPITLKTETVVIALPFARATINDLNLGKAQLCRAGKVSLPSVELQSVICLPGTNACTILLTVPVKDVNLAAPAKDGDIVTVRKAGATCP